MSAAPDNYLPRSGLAIPIPPPGRSAWQRLLDILVADRRHVWVLGTLQAFQAITYIPFTAAITYLIDNVVTPAGIPFERRCWLVAAWAGALLLLWPVHAWCTIRAYGLSQELIRTTTARLRRMTIDHLQRMSLSYFTRRGAGALSNQVTVDLGRVEGFLGNVVGSFLASMTIGIASSAYIFWLNWKLALIAGVAVPFQILVIRKTNRRVRELNRNVQRSGEMFSARIVEFIGGMRLTKSLGNEELAASQLGDSIEEIRVRGLSQSLYMRKLTFLLQFLTEYSTTLVWCAAAVMVLRGHATLGQAFGFLAVLGFVRGGLYSWLGAYDTWQQARPGMESLLALLDSRELEDYHHAARHVEIAGAVTFSGVSFRYPGAANTPVLEAIDLYVPAGQRVGLVGETGAGKSTFLDLILGFYKPNQGTVLYDGHDLATIGLRQLRRSCAIMSQDAFLWNTSVRENIRYGRPTATDAEVENAARRAQAHEFICHLENGYDTSCGERGSSLSGGQRQRIALARLFLRQPRIIVFDEPTSALDIETEARLQRDLDVFCEGRTTFIVAHRLSTLHGVNRILVFRKGRIIEDGSPEELQTRSGGHFARLHAITTQRARTPRPG